MDDRTMFEARRRTDDGLDMAARDVEAAVDGPEATDADAVIDGAATDGAESTEATEATESAEDAEPNEPAEPARATGTGLTDARAGAVDRGSADRRSPGADGRPRAGAVPATGPRSRADRPKVGERSTPVDWATLVDDLAASNRPAFTAATTEDREMELRLCHLHLRTGSFATARIQLETLAGAGHLDRDGLLDLAEARWRTGDLPGAAQAVDTYLEAGGNAPMGHVIAAEARSALGRPGEARRHARLAIEGLEVPLDALFAGQARSSVWPHDPTMAPLTDTLFGSANAATAEQGGRIGVAAGGARGLPSRGRPERADAAAWVAQGPGGAVGGGYPAPRLLGSDRGAGGAGPNAARGGRGGAAAAGVAPLSGGPDAGSAAGSVAARSGGAAPSGVVRDAGTGPDTQSTSTSPAAGNGSGGTGLWDDDAAPVEISSDAHAELERARAALADGELHAAALRLAVVLRLSPALAPVVLDVVAPWPGPEFAMVRGDALRLVGRESAARQAYAAASAGIVDAAPRPHLIAVPSARNDSRLVIESTGESDPPTESDGGRSANTSPSPSPLAIDRDDPPRS